ncbi:TPA: hypothetical protein DEP58_04100 [Patescibacteria group bacterium]|nr:MAG: hypothetical protein UU98_C0037G0006 [Parcubacteria group bacterium GW2011_GWD2_42_14]HCC05457.1 hypothetical protein [Patescibacteria group bacterium]
MGTVSFKNIHVRIESCISWLEWSLLALALLLYIYFIAMTVIQVVLRQELLVAVQEAETRVSNLEASYIEGSSVLSQDTATSLGLVEVPTASYVTVAHEGHDLLTRNQ